MLGCKQDTWRHRLWLVGHVASLSTAFYLYVLLRIRPGLLYQQRSQVFVFDSYLAAEFFRWPGGPVQYVSAFLSPLLGCNWLGALIITLLVLLICLATRHFLTTLTGMVGNILFLVPGVLLVLLLGQYLHPLEPCVGLFVVLVCANAYARIAASCAAVRFAAFVLAGVLAYYVATGLYVVFALLGAIIEWGVKRQWLLGTLEALSTAVVPGLLGIGWFTLTTAQAYEGLTPPDVMYWLEVPASPRLARIAWGSLLFFAPAAGAALVGRRWWRGEPNPVSRPAVLEDAQGEPTSRSAGLAWVMRLAVPSLALLAMGCLADLLAFDAPRRCTLQIARSVEQRRWPEVLALASQIPPQRLHVAVMAHVNRALYHTGGLLERMFARAQVMRQPTLSLIRRSIKETVVTAPMECSDILFELGCVNKSEHLSYEALEVFGDRPHTIKQLVYVHVLKGQPEAARRYLSLLKRSFRHRQWAYRCCQQLDEDPTLGDVATVAECRKLMIARDFVAKLELEPLLLRLLKGNRHNRMAFEYLMAHYLLTDQLEKLVDNLYRFGDFDYPQLPRHCQEALVIYQETTGKAGPDLGELHVDPGTRQRYYQFLQAAKMVRWGGKRTYSILYRDFGDSYFFCHKFGQSSLP